MYLLTYYLFVYYYLLILIQHEWSINIYKIYQIYEK